MAIDRWPLWIARVLKYEFWPAEVFYFPFLFYYIYLGIRAGDLGFIFRLNPFMTIGGAIGTGKMANLARIAPEYRPVSLPIGEWAGEGAVRTLVREHGLSFPLMVKPDVGERGRGVQRVESETELCEALTRIKGDVVVQEYVDSRNELGVLCYRQPATGRIRVISVVSKVFLSVTGNGMDDIKALMKGKLRARMRYQDLLNALGNRADYIPAQGEDVYLEPVGNHCRGTEFCNSQDLINQDLDRVFHRICATMPDFDYGRFDIKFDTLENLYKGLGIKVLEFNGVNSEAGHIYGRGYGLRRAYRDVKEQFDTMYAIYRAKYRNGSQEPTFLDAIRVIMAHRRLERLE